MKKLNFFNKIGKNENLSVTEIQNKIEDKIDIINDLESELSNADDSLRFTANAYDEEIDRKKQALNVSQENADGEIVAINSKIEETSYKRKGISDKKLNQTKKKIDKESQIRKEFEETKIATLKIYEEAKELNEKNLSYFKSNQDNLFSVKRNEMIASGNVTKEELTKFAAIEYDRYKKELEQYQKDIDELQFKLQEQLNQTSEILQKQLDEKLIIQQNYDFEYQSLQEKNNEILKMMKLDLSSKTEQLNSEFNLFGMENQEIIEQKKMEFNALQEKEKNLKQELKIKQRYVDTQKMNLEKEFNMKSEEIAKYFAMIHQDVMQAQQNYEMESDLLKKEMDALQKNIDQESIEIENLILRCTTELNEIKLKISDDTILLNDQYQEECDKIISFYKNLIDNEEIKLEQNILFIKEDIKREQEKFSSDKKSYEEQKVIIENDFYRVMNQIKDQMIRCDEEKEIAKVNNLAIRKQCVQEFEDEKLRIETNINEQKELYERRKQEIMNAVKDANENVNRQLIVVQKCNEELENEVLTANQVLTKLQEDYQIIVNEKEGEIQLLNLELSNYIAKIEKLKEQKNEAQLKHEQDKNEFMAKRSKLIDEHRLQMEQIKNDFNVKSKQFEQLLNEKRKELESKHREDVQKLHEKKNIELEALQQSKLKLSSQYQDEKEKFEASLILLQQDHENNVQLEQAKLVEVQNNLNEYKNENSIALDTLKNEFNNSLAELKQSLNIEITKFNEQELYSRNEVEIAIQQKIDELNALKIDEQSIMNKIVEAQERFNLDKNNLIKSKSNFIEEHLLKMNELENLIAKKKVDIEEIQLTLHNQMNDYAQISSEELSKIDDLKETLQKEIDEQKNEIAVLTEKLEEQKKNQIQVIEARYQAERHQLEMQMQSEIARIQNQMEEEKLKFLEKNALQEKEYMLKVAENKVVIDSFKEQIKEVQAAFDKEELRHQSELKQAEASFMNEQQQLELDFRLKEENHLKLISEIKLAFEQEQKELNFEKIRIQNVIELKVKTLEDKNSHYEKTLVNMQDEENKHQAERNAEISRYDMSVLELNSQIDEMTEKLKLNKEENQKEIDLLLSQQSEVQGTLNDLINNRQVEFEKAVAKIKADHEDEINKYQIQCDEQQELMMKQNIEIISSYETDYKEFENSLNLELDQKRLELALKISTNEELLEKNKQDFEAECQRMNEVEAERVAKRREALELLAKDNENALLEIQEQISLSSTEYQISKESLLLENSKRLEELKGECSHLETQENEMIQKIQNIEESIEKRKLEHSEKIRQQEADCFKRIAEIENVIRQKEQIIASYKEDIRLEVQRGIQERKVEQARLLEIENAKERLLIEERQKITEVIDKQQQIFEKLSAKKRDNMENEIAKNNKILERELRRIEHAKAKAGEEFNITLDDLNNLIAEKEKSYEKLIEQQNQLNARYVEEFTKTLNEKVANEKIEEQNIISSFEDKKDDYIKQEKENIQSYENNLNQIKVSHEKEYDEISKKNNEIVKHLEDLHVRHEILKATNQNDSANRMNYEFINDFENKIEQRNEMLRELESEEASLRSTKLAEVQNLSEEYDRMVDNHQQNLERIEKEIDDEQTKLAEFEEELSEKRRSQKEEEIHNKNLFAKKLNYLKQRMFDN